MSDECPKCEEFRRALSNKANRDAPVILHMLEELYAKHREEQHRRRHTQGDI